jgi:hypothetical protein
VLSPATGYGVLAAEALQVIIFWGI